MTQGYTNLILPDYIEQEEPEEKVIWKPLPGSQTLSLSCPASVILTHGTRGPGKRIANETPVLTSTGWKNAGDITYDDKLVAIDGTFCSISGIFPCKDRPLYNVEFYDGTVIEADDEHRWLTLNNKTGYREGWKVRTTEQLRKMSVGCSVPYIKGAVDGAKWEGEDPYAIGYIIANGTTASASTTVYSIDDEILEYFVNTHGWYRYKYEQTAMRACCPRAQHKMWVNAVGGNKTAEFKSVPPAMLRADPHTRLRLLQGLMDGDGYCDSPSKSEYKTVSLQLAKDVVELVQSLGGRAKWHYQDTSNQVGALSSRGYVYRVKISHHNMFNPFWVKRKASKVGQQKKFLTRGIKSITYSRHGDGVCFAVDHPDHCFVIKDYVVTHNTDGQLMRFRRFVGQGYGKYLRGIIFDREYKNLDDIVSKSRRWFPEFNDGAEFKTAKSDYKWVWPTGEELLFRTLKDPKDYWAYHGQEFCPHVDTIVKTQLGYVRIGDVKEGDSILTPSGFRKVTKTLPVKTKDCFTIRFTTDSNHTFTQTVSNTHKFMDGLRNWVAKGDLRSVSVFNQFTDNVDLYGHPYTKAPLHSRYVRDVINVDVVDCGQQPTRDIEVSDVNCYLTFGDNLDPRVAVANKNCWIGWNELTKYPTDELFEAMMSCNRSSFRPEDHPIRDSDGKIIGYPPPIPLEVFATTNPFGPGHNWVKKRFIDKSKPGEILQTAVDVFNPRTQQRETFIKTQCHIFGSYRENVYLDPQYVAELEAIQDPNKRAAWLGGSWDITSGGMFDDVWSSTDNIVAPFMIPNSWRIFRSYDHGQSKPFSVGWWAESDGSDYELPNGKVVSSVRGDLFRIAEWYGWTGKQNQGLRMISTDIAKGIIERELAMGIHSRVKPGPADNAIWNVDDGNSIADKMEQKVKINGVTYKGVEWTKSDKVAGSRKAHWEVMRISMKNAHRRYVKMPDGARCQIPREEPGLFVFSNCARFIDLIPSMPRDEVDQDDIDTNCEDHIADETGYAVASTALYKVYKNIKGI